MPFTADRCYETSTTTGTGDITLAGAFSSDYQTWATAFATGSSVMYSIVNSGAGEWETGKGTLTGATTLRRDTVVTSSNSNALVNFTSGTKQVFATLIAQFLTRQGNVAAQSAKQQLP